MERRRREDAGHREEEPTWIAGVAVRPSEIEGLVRSQIDGIGPWSQRDDQTGYDGLLRALADAGALGPAFGTELLRLLGAADEPRTDAALAGLLALGPALDPEALADTLRLAAGRLRRAPHRYGGSAAPDRWSLALQALSRAVRHGCPGAIDLLRSEAQGPSADYALPGLARVDPHWLIGRARGLDLGGRLAQVLRHLPTEAHRHALLAALGPWTADRLAALRAAPFWVWIAADERDRLLARLGPG